MAKKYHPDIYHGDKKFAEEKMKQINEAYSVLDGHITQSFTDYSSYSNFGEEFQHLRHEYMRVQKEREERLRKFQEELERINTERWRAAEDAAREAAIKLCKEGNAKFVEFYKTN